MCPDRFAYSIALLDSGFLGANGLVAVLVPPLELNATNAARGLPLCGGNPRGAARWKLASPPVPAWRLRLAGLARDTGGDAQRRPRGEARHMGSNALEHRRVNAGGVPATILAMPVVANEGAAVQFFKVSLSSSSRGTRS